jgi:hypothetical protein
MCNTERADRIRGEGERKMGVAGFPWSLRTALNASPVQTATRDGAERPTRIGWRRQYGRIGP